jgi:hypothetical protein
VWHSFSKIGGVPMSCYCYVPVFLGTELPKLLVIIFLGPQIIYDFVIIESIQGKGIQATHQNHATLFVPGLMAHKIGDKDKHPLHVI